MFKRITACSFLLCAVIAHAQPATPASPPGSGQPAAQASRFATIVGVVVDSIDGGGLSGATVMVAGTDRQAIVDSTGRFAIDSIPAGAYVLGVFHPLLDSLNLSVSSKAIPFAAGMVTTVIMATPSAPTTIALYCSEGDRKLGPGAVIGRVLAADSDDPITSATVRYTSVSIEVSKDVGVKRKTFTREAKVKPSGQFALCGLPTTGGGTVRAARGQIVTGEMLADVSRRLLAITTLRLDTLRRGTAVVVGKIVDEKGTPIPHVDIALAGSNVKASTGDSGTFALRDLPAGSQTVEIRKVGFMAMDTAVMLSSKTPAQVAVTLHAAPAKLGTVNVDAMRLAALDRVGFERRRKAGMGHYLTADQIQNRGAVLFSDLARMMPGLMVRYTRNGQPIVTQSRGAMISGRSCVAYSVDGFPYQDIPRGSIDTYARAQDMIGLEVYQPGEVPAEITVSGPQQTCTVVVIWTRATSPQ